MFLLKRYKRSLPNVVRGASVLRVTGSMSVAGTDQKQFNKQWRFKKCGKRKKIILKMNPFNPIMFKKNLWKTVFFSVITSWTLVPIYLTNNCTPLHFASLWGQLKVFFCGGFNYMMTVILETWLQKIFCPIQNFSITYF